jgi:ribosome biogenesis GTPase
MPNQQSNRQFRSYIKGATTHEQRLELKELRRQRSVVRSARTPVKRERFDAGDLDVDELDPPKQTRGAKAPKSSPPSFRAANIDQVVVVCTPEQPPFRPRLIDRYLVAASRDSLSLLLCLNKTDLGVSEAVERYLQRYNELVAGMVHTSTVTQQGVEDLREHLRGKASLFVGHSGVGKSSLLNALEPGLSLRVGEVTQAAAGLGKGRHTTTSARFIPLSVPNTYVIDSPGIREFGIDGIHRADLALHFADLNALAQRCLYRDCLHETDDGCAVGAAAKEDWFVGERLASYLAMLKDLARSSDGFVRYNA